MNKTQSHLTADLGRIRRIHFIGIGGVGMSGIAEVLLNQGYNVSGSDLKMTPTTERLQKLGAEIKLEHNPLFIEGSDCVVVSSAIPAHNPELVQAREARIPIVPRAQMLAELMRFRHGIAIAGTHGKTTTTSLISSIFAKAGLDPTYVIGGRLNQLGSNAYLGKGQYMIVEADESDASFLFLMPMCAIVTNIDTDHMSTYHNDFGYLQQSFVDFINRLPFYGLAVLCTDDPHVKNIIPQINRPILTYDLKKDADVYATHYEQRGTECEFRVYRYGDHPPLDIHLKLAGRHNVLNSLAAITVATEYQIPDEAIQEALAEFSGIARRFQVYSQRAFPKGKVTLVDDYGHHPREIAATVAALRAAWPDAQAHVVFQPHRYSRTSDLFDDFSAVLADTNGLYLLDIDSAGENPIAGITSQALCQDIRRRGKVQPLYVPDYEALIYALEQNLHDGDVLLIQGAGAAGGLAPKLLAKYPQT